MLDVLGLARQVGLAGAVDILLMAVFVYAALVLLRRSHAASAFHGLLLIGGVYLVARQFGLALTAAVLEAFFAVLVLALIVIFREELRRFFEQVARWNPTSRLSRQLEGPPTPSTVEILSSVLGELAANRVGAILVLPGAEPIYRHLDGGTILDGELSPALIRSLFDPNSPGHDGAVVIEGGRIRRFACHLPLSRNFDQLADRGTRHAAALGLTERCDALCIVVSEERGTISLAEQGELRTITSTDELLMRLRAYGGTGVRTARRWTDPLRRDIKLKALAVVISFLLWMALVYGSRLVMRSYRVPVACADCPPDRLVSVEPSEVQISLVGARREFYFTDWSKLEVLVRYGGGERSGEQTRRIRPSDVSFPRALTLRDVEPDHVVLRLMGAEK